MNVEQQDQVRQIVREAYGKVASGTSSNCGTSCCGPGPEVSRLLGYSAEEMAAVPEGANLGLGCGNPQTIASLKEGETVLDLGSGAGFDVFLAARQVGAAGRVIGVDMTAEMISKARANAAKIGASNVEFRLGEIEHLPLADATVDVILSNCVINLSPDKAQVFRDAFRVLRPGGRLAISDVVCLAEMPAELRRQAEAIAACVAGAARADALEAMLREIGFAEVKVVVNEASRQFIREWAPGSGAENYVASATIEARKPGASCCGPSCCA